MRRRAGKRHGRGQEHLPGLAARSGRGRSRPRRALRPRRRRHRPAAAEAARRHRARAGRGQAPCHADHPARTKAGHLTAEIDTVETPEPEGVEVTGAGPLGDRAVRELFEGQPQAAGRDRGPARPDRGALEARRRGRRQRQHQGLRQAGPARRARSGPPPRNGVRLHGGRARRACRSRRRSAAA